MSLDNQRFAGEFYTRFKVFHELMSRKVREILLVSSPYDAYILEEDGSLAARIVTEYAGLNLSMPPRVKRVDSAAEALDLLTRRHMDLVITMPYLDDMTACTLGSRIKAIQPDLPVILLHQSARSAAVSLRGRPCDGVDRVFVWTGNSDLLLALVKNAEDALNVDRDTREANVPVLILVEDSAVYRSHFLPFLYKLIVRQTQAVLNAGLNEEHRLLLMRARPKILLAETYEAAVALYEKYRPHVLTLISDTRFPCQGLLDDRAGITLLKRVRDEIPDLPLLLLSSEPHNREQARSIPAEFLDKNDPDPLGRLQEFFLTHLGFGDFVFRMPDGVEVGRATSLRELVEKLPFIPDESVRYHADRNHFSRWIAGRSEIALAAMIRKVKAEDFADTKQRRQYLIDTVQAVRGWQQKGVVTQFRRHNFDAGIHEFAKIGGGSLGGKARGLAFMNALLQDRPDLHARHPRFRVGIPRTLVITTQGFESFVDENRLRDLADGEPEDDAVRDRFLAGIMPRWLADDLRAFVTAVRHPLSVRSSSRLEDAHFQPYAGLYHTAMIPNRHPDEEVRLGRLFTAIQRVYASTWFRGPKAFSRSTGNQHREEAMAVIIQQLGGRDHGGWFYPAVSGVAQSHNFYPVGPMKPGDGIAHIALGLGKTVVDGGRALRFCPRYPTVLPQFSSVAATLDNAQRHFYALRLPGPGESPAGDDDTGLTGREVDEAVGETPVQRLASTFIPEEERLRDTGHGPGPKIMTFASLIQHGEPPLAPLLSDLLDLGRRAMGCPVEIEFSLDLPERPGGIAEFFLLQIRPLVAQRDMGDIRISDAERNAAFCVSGHALGHGVLEGIHDIVYVKPDAFRAESTRLMADQVARINADLERPDTPYLLIGPGRWGSADHWLGIPVRWRDISGAKVIVELRNRNLRVDPSQGSHFFQNIASLGVHYVTVDEEGGDRMDWAWLNALPLVVETGFLRHVRVKGGVVVKTDGGSARCVMKG